MLLVGCSKGNNQPAPLKEVLSKPEPKLEMVSLNIWEKKALEFVEAASVHKSEEKTFKLLDQTPKIINLDAAMTMTVLPGKVKVASRPNGSDSWTVRLFIPYPQSKKAETILTVDLWQKGNAILIYNYGYENINYYQSFEEFQSSNDWIRKGSSWEWKNAELH